MINSNILYRITGRRGRTRRFFALYLFFFFIVVIVFSPSSRAYTGSATPAWRGARG